MLTFLAFFILLQCSTGFIYTQDNFLRSSSSLREMSTRKEQGEPLLLSLSSQLRHRKLILASQSPRRREILEMMGLKGLFEATPSPLDETKLQKELVARNLSPPEYTRVLAEDKAKALAITRQNGLVLGSDTIVDLDGVILEKPRDASDAKRMLRMLSGVQHSVHTGVALYTVKEGSVELVRSFTETAKVQFATLSEVDIEAYVASGEPMDKAGAYGIQGMGGQMVSAVNGDFFAVMGLPMHRTSLLIAEALATD